MPAWLQTIESTISLDWFATPWPVVDLPLRNHALAVGALWSLACGGVDVEIPYRSHDLVAELAYAESHSETTFVDFGSESAREYTRDGWSADDASSTKSWIWGTGESSSVEVRVLDSRTRDLIVRCWPFVYPGAPVQVLSARVNGVLLGERELIRGPSEPRWKIPAGVLRAGPNTLSFEYATQREPREVIPNSLDPRPLAVAWDWLRLEGGSAPGVGASPRAEKGSLVLPAGFQLNYFAWLAPGSRFSFDSLAQRAAGPAEQAPTELQVRLRFDGEATTHAWDFSPSSGPQTISLPAQGQIAQLSLLALGPTAAGGALRLLRPRLDVPESSPHAADSASLHPPPTQNPRSNVLIYAVDTLRADHLGSYGGERTVSPRIDEFAKRATVFLGARANSSWTRPAVASILTGLHPWSHGANDTRDALPDEVRTLAEILSASGYETAGFTTNGNVSGDFGFAQGFDTYRAYREDLEARRVHTDAAKLNEDAIAWLEGRGGERPFFLYLHATDPHAPYAPPEPYLPTGVASLDPHVGSLAHFKELAKGPQSSDEALRNQLIALYDAEISFADHQFGLLLDALERADQLDDTLVVFTSDHGEEFQDHGQWQHGTSLYGEQLRIPLIIKPPRGRDAGTRVSGVAQQIDVVPTVLGVVGVSSPEELPGRDLFAEAATESEPRPVLALLDREGRHFESVQVGRFKLIEHLRGRQIRAGSAQTETFDLQSDPQERWDLTSSRPVLVGYLKTLLRKGRARWVPLGEESVQLDGETERRLRSLGYLR